MPLLSSPADLIPNVQQSRAFYDAATEVITPRESSLLGWLFISPVEGAVRQAGW